LPNPTEIQRLAALMKYTRETRFLQQYLRHFFVGWVELERNPTHLP